jgi:hypothetical protein
VLFVQVPSVIRSSARSCSLKCSVFVSLRLGTRFSSRRCSLPKLCTPLSLTEHSHQVFMFPSFGAYQSSCSDEDVYCFHVEKGDKREFYMAGLYCLSFTLGANSLRLDHDCHFFFLMKRKRCLLLVIDDERVNMFWFCLSLWIHCEFFVLHCHSMAISLMQIVANLTFDFLLLPQKRPSGDNSMLSSLEHTSDFPHNLIKLSINSCCTAALSNP